MHTQVLPVDPHSPEPEVITRAAEVLRQGGLVAFPTETVYGLGANALDADAVRRIFKAKGRPATNPLIVHIADLETIHQLVITWPEAAQRLAERFWPGPLTLVLPRRDVVPDIVTGGGPTPGGLESTVLDLSGSAPRLLRPGLVSPSEIEELIGPIIQRGPVAADESRPLPSPGMSRRHYAPRTRLELAADEGRARVLELLAAGLRVGWLSFANVEEVPEAGQLVHVEMPADPESYAASLYATLHRLDAAGLDRIVVALPPDEEAWLAVRDRLRRAAEPA
jgi:L-threonylcarbamoyladenylate synthase